MPSNPLTNPNWAADVADKVESLVGSVRDKTTTPVLKGARFIVYGFLAALLGLTLLALVLIAATRGLQALLDLFLSWPRAVYISYLAVGGILSLVGLFLLRKRHAPN